MKELLGNNLIYIVFGLLLLLFVISFISMAAGRNRIQKQHAEDLKRLLDVFNSLPDLDTYLADNPACKSSSGPKCKKCSSNHFGTQRVADVGVIHFCKKCRTDLYRTE